VDEGLRHPPDDVFVYTRKKACKSRDSTHLQSPKARSSPRLPEEMMC
jgi:hypothetical protein